jgi:hypothetical protein
LQLDRPIQARSGHPPVVDFSQSWSQLELLQCIVERYVIVHFSTGLAGIIIVNQNIEKTKVPVHVYVLVFVVAIVTAVGVSMYNSNHARSLIESPETANSLSVSPAFTNAMDTSVERVLQSENADIDLDTLLSNSVILQGLIDQAVTERLVDYGNSPDFQDSVSLALPQVSDIQNNAGLLKQIQNKMKQYESNLAKVTRRVNDDESVQAVNDLQSNFVELQQLIGGLSQEMRCSLAMVGKSKSSFLLKEKRSTELQVYKLIISLGSIKKDLIESVTISGPNADSSRADTRVIANVRLGSEIDFQSGEHNYKGVFTFRQARLGPDFVGFEVQEILIPGEDCLADA